MSTAKKYTYFIGIDVSKNELDFAILRGHDFLYHREIANDKAAIRELIAEMKQLPGFSLKKALFCMEATGIYCNHVVQCLDKCQADFVMENALHIKLFGGVTRGKNDKIDSIRIAQYTAINYRKMHLYTTKRGIVQQLAELSALRNRMVATRMALKTPMKEQYVFVNPALVDRNASLCQSSIAAMDNDLVKIDALMLDLIHADNRLDRLFTIITSVPGFGAVTAIQIIIITNEFRSITDPKKFACYAGVAPFVRSSGKLKGKARVSSFANKRLKGLLHTCAMSILRRNDELRTYYERKTGVENKPKMAVMNAIRYKLVLRVFACLAQDRLYEKDYQRPTAVPIEMAISPANCLN